GEPRGPGDGVHERLLVRVVGAVEVPGVGVIAVVGDVDAVLGRPHEAADHCLGVEVALRVRHLDAGDLHARSDTGHADTVLRGRDLARHVRAVRALRGA